MKSQDMLFQLGELIYKKANGFETDPDKKEIARALQGVIPEILKDETVSTHEIEQIIESLHSTLNQESIDHPVQRGISQDPTRFTNKKSKAVLPPVFGTIIQTLRCKRNEDPEHNQEAAILASFLWDLIKSKISRTNSGSHRH